MKKGKKKKKIVKRNYWIFFKNMTHFLFFIYFYFILFFKMKISKWIFSYFDKHLVRAAKGRGYYCKSVWNCANNQFSLCMQRWRAWCMHLPTHTHTHTHTHTSILWSKWTGNFSANFFFWRFFFFWAIFLQWNRAKKGNFFARVKSSNFAKKLII